LAEVALRLFGTPCLDIDGKSIRLGRRKAMALLSYLAVTRSRHHRETLAALLWPESGPAAAFSALRNVLWILRQTSLAPLLHTDRSTVELVEDGTLRVDVVSFRDLTGACPTGDHPDTSACPACAPALAEAVSLAEAPFMEGFMVANASGFDDWQFAEREALQRELTETLDRLTAHYGSVGDWDAVVSQARRWLRVDRLNEVCCRRLMEALGSLGRRGEALRCYEECARTLKEELGLSPERATAETAEWIRHAEIARIESSAPTTPVRATNLPAPLTSFVGRDKMISQVRGLLAEDQTRLVTLVGLGGIGKTSLATQVGWSLLDELDDGVFLVPLGTVEEQEMIAPTIAEALGLPHSRDRGADLALALSDFVRERRMLLILDEVEGTPEIGSTLTDLLSAAPGLWCLVTSHVPLNVRGESVVAVHGLDYPQEDASTESLGEYDAVRLLKVAERRADAPAMREEDELGAMARVARMLEGFPLGLEMAGAWRGVFSWREIAERISANLDFLVHTHRDVPPRHRNLRAVYEQAWSLLSREERASLGGLAVFRGGFTIEAAEQTTDSSPPVLAALARRSLIRRVAPERYQLHELLRQFSLANLRDEDGGHGAVADRHAAYFAGYVGGAFQRLKGPEQVRTLHRLQEDVANVRAAWLHAAEAGRSDLLRRAAHGLFFWFDMSARFEEGARAFKEAIRRFDDTRDEAVAGFLRVAYGWFSGFTAEAEPDPWIREGLERLDTVEPFSVDHALANVIACYAGGLGGVEEARERLGGSLAEYRRLEDRWGEALTLSALAAAVFPHDPEEGERLAAEGLRLRREIGDRWGEALSLAIQAHFAEAEGDWDLAGVRYDQSERLAAAIAEDLHMVVNGQIARARIARKLGQYDEAETLAHEGLTRARQAGSRLLVARALMERGRLALSREETERAREHLEEAYAVLEGTPWSGITATCAAMLAELAEAASDERGAAEWRARQRTLGPGRKGGEWTD